MHVAGVGSVVFDDVVHGKKQRLPYGHVGVFSYPQVKATWGRCFLVWCGVVCHGGGYDAEFIGNQEFRDPLW